MFNSSLIISYTSEKLFLANMVWTVLHFKFFAKEILASLNIVFKTLIEININSVKM